MNRKMVWQVDAFADAPYHGNPCAVVFEADDIPTERMQQIAAEMNLSETVFLLKPERDDADYRARIFTPQYEMPFAGHPTLSASYAVSQLLARAGYGPRPKQLRQECGAGVIPVDILPGEDGEDVFSMTQVLPDFRDVDIHKTIFASALGVPLSAMAQGPIQTVSTGVWWTIVPLVGASSVANCRPDMTALGDLSKKMGTVGVCVFAIGAKAHDCDVKLRVFAPGAGVPEDPVTGSANGCLAAYIARHGLLDHNGNGAISYTAEQGTEMGREGRAYISVPRGGDGAPVVAGKVVPLMEGSMVV